MSAITLLSHINIRFTIFSGSYHSPFLSVFIGDEKPRKPHEMRRKRAIILFACQSFAWFTSKDEVTNRLTASADYNVSIIENFAPPKQWVPGQSVTKEEAVVNTGNIDAFVHQTVSSVLQITVEVPTTVAPTGLDTADYIKLDETEAGTLEAGSYLAGAFDVATGDPLTGVDVGNKVIKVINTGTEASGKLTDFNPTKTGLYIFRRAITVKNGSNPAEDEKYEYVGYYYVAPTDEEAAAGKTGTYYKLHNIIKDSLVLEEDGNGNLASAPDVTYAKETKQTLNKAPMTYEAAVTTGDPDKQHGDRLVISYDKNASAATTSYSQQTFEAYRDYLDSLQGKTTWDTTKSTTGGTTPVAKDSANKTGLIDNDEFLNPNTDYNKDPDTTEYKNFSSERLATRKNETETAVTNASPANWTTVYENAVKDRKVVNRGVKASEELIVKRTNVLGLIGSTTTQGEPGLYQNPNYTFHYEATTATADPYATGAIELKTPVPNTYVGGGQTAVSNYADHSGNKVDGPTNLDNMTADTMDNAMFAHYNSDGVYWNVVTKPYNSSVAASSALATAWDNYENAVKEEMLIQKKIDICDAVVATTAGGSTTSVARITKADGSKVEVAEYKEWLEEQLATHRRDVLGPAKTAYEAQKKIVNDNIKDMNDLQDEVNLANEVDYNKAATAPTGFTVVEVYKGDKSITANTNYPAAESNGYRSVVFTTGTDDTVTEQILKQYLENVYGVAYTDQQSDTTKKADYYDGTTRLDHPTYSPDVTKKAIDDSVKAGTNGVIEWKDDVSELIKTTTPAHDDTDTIANSLYYEDKRVGFMKTYRDGITKNKKDAYDALVKAENLDAANGEKGTVKIYVNLDNIGDGSTGEKWQYVPEAATGDNVGKDFNFYYTSILGSGDVSSLLIKSLEFDKDVKQEAFRDIQLDLNVASESAQVVYNGDMAQSTAANASIYGADPEKAEYALTEAVKWVADTTAVTGDNVINDKDPNPKADANVPAPATP